MSMWAKLVVAVLLIAAFLVLAVAGWAAGKTSTGAFLGAMVAGFGYELAQRWDRRLRGY